jgi:ribonuclease P protein component
MLPRSKRLSRAEIAHVLKAGTRASDPMCDMRYLKGQSFKAAVIVSKKVARTSVARHRIKRSVFAALHTLPASAFHVVVFPKKPEARVTSTSYTTVCERILNRLTHA